MEEMNRFLEVGWVLDKVKASFIWEAPSVVRLGRLDHASSKAVTACPAVLQQEAALFEIKCPIDVKLSLVNEQGQWLFRNDLGNKSAINTEYLQNMLIMMPEDQWRHPERPVIQMHTPYRCVTDQRSYLNMMPPFYDYKASRWPGVVLGGRFQLDNWPRKLMWSFEWHDTKQSLWLKRSEPWFCLKFDGENPGQNVRMAEAEWTNDLEEYVRGMDEVTNYVNKTMSLMKTASDRRPSKLLSMRHR